MTLFGSASTSRVAPSAAWSAWLVPAVLTMLISGGMGGLLNEHAGVPVGLAALTVIVQVAVDLA